VNSTVNIIRITIDSNTVLDCYERPDRFPEARELVSLHPDRVKLQVANRTPNQEATRWASELDILQVERQVNFFRLDMSVLDGPDVLAGEDDVDRHERLKAIVFPEGVEIVPGQPDMGKLCDIDILDAHIRSGAEYIVTRDQRLLTARDALRAEFGIEVLTPAEALARLRAGS
jgi:hypothetical protein